MKCRYRTWAEGLQGAETLGRSLPRSSHHGEHRTKLRSHGQGLRCSHLRRWSGSRVFMFPALPSRQQPRVPESQMQRDRILHSSPTSAALCPQGTLPVLCPDCPAVCSEERGGECLHPFCHPHGGCTLWHFTWEWPDPQVTDSPNSPAGILFLGLTNVKNRFLGASPLSICLQLRS